MKLIKNDFVSMDWDADWFLESHENGFVGAIWTYDGSKGEVPVCFHEKEAFILVDEDGCVFDKERIKKCFAEVNRAGDIMRDYFEENYVCLGSVSSGIDEDNCMLWGLSMEDAQDIANRLGDVSCYWCEFSDDEEGFE